MLKLLLIGLAGFAGTIGRYWLAGMVGERYGENFRTEVAGLFLFWAGDRLAGLI